MEPRQNLLAELIELALFGLQMGLILAAAGGLSKLFGLF